MQVNILRKHGSNLCSDDYKFTFHGLYLVNRYIEQFMYEKGTLVAVSKYDSKNIIYIPFEDIYEIEVQE